jgi:hypothetical protein
MTLAASWAFSLGATPQQMADSEWGQLNLTQAAYNSTAAPLPRQPTCGHGGMTMGLLEYGVAPITYAFPKAAINDGIVQFHVYMKGWNTSYSRVRLLSEGGTVLLELRPKVSFTTFGVTAIECYSGEGSLTLRGTTVSAVWKLNTWMTVSIRFKPGATGYIQVGVDGRVDTIVNGDVTGATSDWRRVQWCSGAGGYVAEGWVVTGLSVWDDATADVDAMTLPYFHATLRPKTDEDVTGWTDEAGGTTNLFDVVNNAAIDPAHYLKTVTGEVLTFGVDTSDISASWNPDSIAGVNIMASMRGEGWLCTAEVQAVAGVQTNEGTVAQTDPETSQAVSDVLPLSADHATPWTPLLIDSTNFGVYGGA